MPKGKDLLKMVCPTLIMAAIALILLYMGYRRGRGEHITGMQSGLNMIIEILPLLVFSFMVAGMVRVLIPHELLSKWVGAESGMKGILIGSLAGLLAPGGPYVNFPIVAALMRSGANIGTTVAFLTAWSLCALTRLPMEVGILGWRFAMVRTTCTFFFPPIAGFIAQNLFGSVK